MTVTRCGGLGSPVHGCPCQFCRRVFGTILCPRCEGQQFDVDACGLCGNRGVLDEHAARMAEA